MGLSSLDIGEADYNADATGFKAIVGWRFIDWMSVEGGYIDFGSGDDDIRGETLEIDASALTLSAVGFLPIGPVDLFGRVGVVDWDADLS